MFRRLTNRSLLAWLLLPVVVAIANEQAAEIRFRKTRLDTTFRSEGVAVGDFNHDGRADIAAGFVWYEAPTWKMHQLTADERKYDPAGYSNSFVNVAHDVNQDGWVDLIVVGFPGMPTWWFENPRNEPGPWKRHQITPVSNNESPQFVDVTGDGKPELIMGFSPDAQQPDGPDRRMAYLTPQANPTAAWTIHPISVKSAPGTKKYDHGLGIGDINQDGRQDIVVPQGWWEAPPGYTAGLWKFHPAPLGDPAAQMHVYDFDADGDNDVLSSSAHGFGIWWHERVGDNEWVTHTIDDSFSQTHGLCLADINGDGLMDFVTGKRWWAHGGRDPGGDQPAVFCWFELQRAGGRATWVRHQFDHDSGPGTQFEVTDVNGDGYLDIVTSNKKGVHYFEQVRK